MVAVADKGEAGQRPVNRFKPPDVLIDVIAHFHLEQAKSLFVPASRQREGLCAIANRNGDVGFAFPQVGAAPQFPQRQIPRPAVGVDQGGFQGTTRGGLPRRLLAHAASRITVRFRRGTQQCAAEPGKGRQAGLPGFASDFGKRGGFPIALRAVRQRDADEHVLRDGTGACGYHERIRERNVDGPEVDGLDALRGGGHSGRHLNGKST